MNATRLLLAFAFILVGSLVYNSFSILTPERGADHIFYGENAVDFLTEEVSIGDINRDGVGDIITATYWDRPDPGGAPRLLALESFTCDPPGGDPWTSIVAHDTVDTLVVCDFVDNEGNRQWDYWEALGWDSISAGLCDTCYWYPVEAENQGAIHVFEGGDWSGKAQEIDIGVSPPDLTIYGKIAGDRLVYSGTGNVNDDSYEDMIVGATQYSFYFSRDYRRDNGEVYVIHGSASLPSTIDLADSTDEATYVEHYFRGRDVLDEFGKVIVSGRFDDDDNFDIVVAAPGGDGAANGRNNSGEVWVFYANDSLPQFPDKVDLSTLSDEDIDEYATIIYGAEATDHIGATFMFVDTLGAHEVDPDSAWGYQPPGISVGDWDGDNRDDLVIGAGNARSDSGAVYVIFGRAASDADNKLFAGNIIDLANAPDETDENAPDIAFYGADANDATGAGTGLYDVDADGKHELIFGAPLADDHGASSGTENHGLAYIVYGSDKSSLLDEKERDLSNATEFDSYVDIVVYGEEAGNHFGTYIGGGEDLDNDGYSDLAIGGRYAVPADAEGEEWGEAVVFFGKSRTDWEDDDEIFLKTVVQTDPDKRILKLTGVEHAESNTIRFADLEGDDYKDIVFGGYDAPGKSGQSTAGQMYIIKGQDTWQSGLVSTSTTWSGNVILDGDLEVDENVTLTIKAGTDVETVQIFV